MAVAASPWRNRAAAWSAIACAVMSLALLRQAHGQIERAEREIAIEVDSLPSGVRVISAADFRNTRVVYHQMVERYCIDRCWSYANYEPASGQFRVRATGDGPAVLASSAAVRAVAEGRYVIESRDLPVYVVTNCPPAANRYCHRQLSLGDTVPAPR
jgi:hypothetical protein